MTSAFLALQLLLGETFEHIVVPFDQIFDTVAKRTRRRRPDHSRRPAHLRESRIRKVCSISAYGGKARPGCRSRSAATSSAKTSPPEVRRDVSEILRESMRYGLAHRAAGGRPRHALGAGHGRGARRQVHRHVRERLHARLRRRRPRGDPRFLAQAHTARFHPAPVELEFVS